jgi:amidophosphoribosyltransferase
MGLEWPVLSRASQETVSMCGFIGIVGPKDLEVFPDLYSGLLAIQHRGQDAAGAVTYDGTFHGHKGLGLVRDVFKHQHVQGLTGFMGLAHVRYPTVGQGRVEDAQPFLISYPFGIGMVHNGNVTNFDEIRRDLSKESHWHVNSACDLEGILNVFGDELAQLRIRKLLPEHVFEAVRGVFKRVSGAYSVVGMIAGEGLYAFRDPFGIKPIIVGEQIRENGTQSWCVASESVLMDTLDFHNTFDLAAGEAIFIDVQGRMTREIITAGTHSPCLFEWVYFARPDSFLDKVSVYKTRMRLGESMAERWRKTGWKADVVIPVPESSTTAAMALANALDMKYREGLVKNRYIGRTFIMPTEESRRTSVRHKLNPIQLEFEDKDVLLVDDSIVRGNTSRQIVAMARKAGAKKVYFASVSPPLRHPCIYGIDMSTKSEFVARDRTPEQVAEAIGADGVLYQSLENLVHAVREGNEEIRETCNACFSGHYPTGDVTEDCLTRIETERLVNT